MALVLSILKGETLLDTARNLEAMRPDIIVMRHPAAGACHFLAEYCSASIINAGDGAHEHPTQALLDAMTILDHKDKIEGLEVAIVGDITSSRVARSNIHLLTKLGASVTICGPATMIPLELERLGVQITHRVDEAFEGADIIMVLRIQRERQHHATFPSSREYFKFFGLSAERLKQAKDDVIIMHPGPLNRGVEIAPDVADGPHSVILEQVTNGVAVRMAALYLLIGEEESESPD